MEKYKVVKVLGGGSFGVAMLMRHKDTKELVAMKCIERGHNIDENVAREIVNHRSLRHPNIICFKEVILTPTHLGIVMEYAAGGPLFERVKNAGRFSEDEARYFFQQLISGVSYCHVMQVCHRDLKLGNILLDGSPAPKLKICDFGYSVSSLLHTRPNSTVGTSVYMAPEVLSSSEYDGMMADVWSCGVTLYVMLVGEYPFDPINFEKAIPGIMAAQYIIPDYVHISQDCRHLLSRTFVPNPSKVCYDFALLDSCSNCTHSSLINTHKARNEDMKEYGIHSCVLIITLYNTMLQLKRNYLNENRKLTLLTKYHMLCNYTLQPSRPFPSVMSSFHLHMQFLSLWVH